MRRDVIIAAMLCVALAGCAAPQRREAPVVTPMPVVEPQLTEQFNNISRLGDVYFAGYPTEQGLYELATRGVKTVVCLKSPEEVREARGFDEQAVADEYGMRLVFLPIAPETFSDADVAQFAEIYETTEGPFLLHCGSSNTVGGLWAAYLKTRHDVPLDQALSIGRAAGLRSEAMEQATRRVAGP
jgi:uncharacterized protein (TIGR01244 family)